MHSVANLGTLQTPLVTFFPSKKRPNLVSENHRYCRASARSCSPSARTHLSLLLSLRLLCSARTPLSLSLRLLCSACAHLSLSLSLSLSLCVCSVQRAHLSLSLCVCSVQRAHTSLSLFLSLSLCVCSARGRERSSALIQLNTDIMLLL